MRHILAVITFVGFSIAMGSTIAAQAQQASNVRSLVTRAIDEADRVTLHGNTRPEAVTATDLGAVPDGYPLDHMLLQLKRPAEVERAFAAEIESLQNPSSPRFHHWLQPSEIGDRFGLSAADRQAVANWLVGHGFTVNVEYSNGVLIDFSGTAAQVRGAFQTDIHFLDVAGKRHFANMSDPKIPAALAPVVEGVVSLHDFKPHILMKPRAAYTFGCEDGNCAYGVVPADLATIYNFNAAFTAGLTGKGQTVVVIEDTDVYAPWNWTTFRNKFGLNAYTAGSFAQVHPAPTSGPNNCAAPGVDDDEGEAALDAQWASAAAPDAKIELAACADTYTTFGGLIAFENLIAAADHPNIVSISYGECEAYNGATANAAYKTAYQQAAAEGVSVFVSSGDEGAASCDADLDVATHGIGVSGLASTIYNVAVGGTDFGDTYDHTTNRYWSKRNSSIYGSAKSYVPEIPWNDSCASWMISLFEGYDVAFGANGFCNSEIGEIYFLTTASGSGGPSGCATGAPSISGVVGGTCKGYAKPSWQSLFGNPADAVRDIPDVSLFASNGVWGAYYVFCDSSDARTCSGAPASWAGAGGTSFASPILAGIQALVNENQGEAQGNPNPVYYALANIEFGASGSTSCESLNSGPASTCVFYNVVRGDMRVNCTGTVDCYDPIGINGVLSRSDAADAMAYGAHEGWNFATGIGSVNVYNLINAWSSGLAATRSASTP